MKALTRKKEDFYIKLRKKIMLWLETKEGRASRWGKHLIFAPDLFHLLCKLVGDKDVPLAEKARLGAVIIYFFSPIDLLPELLLGPLGYLDDIALAAYALNRLINLTDPAIVRRHWAGEEDVLQVIQSILTSADKMIGSGLWEKIKGKLG
jgi:uncharacterized membrane protein YkvA (DUF1232 family)